MFSKVYSCGLHGINGFIIDVEIDISDGLPNFENVGYKIPTVTTLGRNKKPLLQVLESNYFF